MQMNQKFQLATVSTKCYKYYDIDHVFNIYQMCCIITFRSVNAVIAEEMNEIHAFTQKCMTPEEWEKKQNK